MLIPCTQLHAQISVSSAAQEECSYHVMIKMLFNTRDQFFYIFNTREINLIVYVTGKVVVAFREQAFLLCHVIDRWFWL